MIKKSICIACLALGFIYSAPTLAAPIDNAVAEAPQLADYPQRYQRWFEEASAEFNVPVEVLQAIAFAETRWRPHVPKGANKDAREAVVEIDWHMGDMPPVYGIMGLRDDNYFGHSLVAAAQLIGVSPNALKQNTRQNIRGAAALLAKLGEGKTRQSSVEEWESAIAQYSGIPQKDITQIYSYEVLKTINHGRGTSEFKVNKRPVDLEKVYGKSRYEVLSGPRMVVPINDKGQQ